MPTTGVVEKIEFTHGAAGNQFTTIGGVRFVTYWDFRTKNWKEGDEVTFNAVERSLWEGSPKMLHAENILKVVSPVQEVKQEFETEPPAITRDQFMDFFRRDDFQNYLSDDDAREVFFGVLKGSSDITPEFLMRMASDYYVGLDIRYSNKPDNIVCMHCGRDYPESDLSSLELESIRKGSRCHDDDCSGAKLVTVG